MTPIKAAIITSGFSKDENDFGGAAAFHNFVKELSLNEEIDVTVFSLYYPLNQPEYNFYNAKVYSFAPGNINSAYSKIKSWRKCEKKFKEEHQKQKFDLIHSMWSRETGFIASRMRRKLKLSSNLRIPFITNVGGGELADLKEISYGSRTSQLQKYFVDRSFSQADTIVSGSDYISDKIKQYYGEIISSKVRKLPFGTDEKMFVPQQYNKNNGLPVLVSIANAVPVKSHETLFKAIKTVSGKFPGIILECYGKDDKNILSGLAEKCGVSGNVSLKGFTDYKKIPAIFSRNSIFVLSSQYESQNMSLTEAAFCGVPVVSTNAGIAKEITENIVTPGDYESLAEKIIFAIENYPSEKQKALSAREQIVSKYSLKRTTQDFVELYKTVTAFGKDSKVHG